MSALDQQADLIEFLLGIEADDAVAGLRRRREEIRRHTQGAFRELVVPEQPGGVRMVERAGLAWRVALNGGEPVLSTFYGDLFRRIATPAEMAVASGTTAYGQDERLLPLLRYGGLVASEPGSVDQGVVDGLSGTGFSVQDIVAVTQLAAFVPFQVRLMAGLRALKGEDRQADSGTVEAAAAGFTTAEVGWTPRVPPVDAETATEAQLAALEACPPAVRRSTYFLTLAQDPGSLGERGALFNSVMYAPRGLPRFERELATAVVSLVNGCVYCFSVHARRFAELTHEPGVMEALVKGGLHVPLDPRRRCIVDFAAKLTAFPQAIGRGDLVPLQENGLSDFEMLDLIHAIAMFANANRLMQALGDSTPL